MSLIDAQLILDAPKLRKERDLLTRAYLYAGKMALTETTREVEKQFEAATQRVVQGRLWRAWKSRVEPSGQRIARDPTGYIFANGGTRTRGAINFITQNGRLSATGGTGWMAVPLPAAGSRGKARNLSPTEWEARTGMKLRPVFRPGRLPLLVADNAVLSGKKQVARVNTSRRIAAGRGSATVPIFVLIPPRDFKARFSVEGITGSAPYRIRQRFEAHAATIRDVRANS